MTKIEALRRVVVALSGGVDSSVVAAAAMAADLEYAVAVTADSPSVPRWQIETAARIATEIGIEHHVMPTAEAERADYRRNEARRCFCCKQTLYQSLEQYLQHDPRVRIVSGTNADDLGDYRPGIEAGRQAGVVTPLADLGLGKARVRELAAHFQLSNHDLPASPCLASRVAYGIEVTPQRLQRIEQAEDWLHQRGYDVVRVRLLQGERASIEVPQHQVASVIQMDADGSVTAALQEMGFPSVTIDPQGFRSGNLNLALVPLGVTRPCGPKEVVP